MSRRFAIIPAIALDDERLKANDILILCALGKHTDKAGWCNVKQATLAEITRLSRGYVNKRIKHLIDCKLVEQHHQTKANKGQVASSYRLIFDIDVAPVDSDYTPQNPDVPSEHIGGADVPLANTPAVITVNTPYERVSINDKKDIAKAIPKKTDLPSRIFEAWNDMAAKHPPLSKVSMSVLQPSKSKQVIDRLADCRGEEGLLFKAILNVPNNPHWLGQSEGNWKADFEFVFRRAQFPKVLEYEAPTPQNPREQQNAKPRYQSRQLAETDRNNNAVMAALEKRQRAKSENTNAGFRCVEEVESREPVIARIANSSQ